jgi:hypothetical protein
MKWANILVLDNGLLEIKDTCNELRLISTYSANDPYATIVANTLSHVLMTPTDFVISGLTGAARIITSASGKQDINAAASGGGAGMHFAFCDGAGGNVLWVTSETSGQPIFVGNTINYPSLTYTSPQPV